MKLFLCTLLFSTVAFINTSQAQYTEFWISGSDSRYQLERGYNSYTINAFFDGQEDPDAVYEWYIGLYPSASNRLNSDGKTISLDASQINWERNTFPYDEYSEVYLTCRIILPSGDYYEESLAIYNDIN